MSFEARAELLRAINPHPLGIRELAKELHHRPQNVISLVYEMKEEGLIQIVREKKNTRGRPKSLVHATILGEDFMNTYRELELKPLRSRKTDLTRVYEDVDYVNRLVSRDISPQKLFLELNSIVRRNK